MLGVGQLLDIPQGNYFVVDADARLPTQREKCAVFLAMTGMGEGLTKANYPNAGAHGCADFPADAYPWETKK